MVLRFWRLNSSLSMSSLVNCPKTTGCSLMNRAASLRRSRPLAASPVLLSPVCLLAVSAVWNSEQPAASDKAEMKSFVRRHPNFPWEPVGAKNAPTRAHPKQSLGGYTPASAVRLLYVHKPSILTLTPPTKCWWRWPPNMSSEVCWTLSHWSWWMYSSCDALHIDTYQSRISEYVDP